jgi:hypothetical protein
MDRALDVWPTLRFAVTEPFTSGTLLSLISADFGILLSLKSADFGILLSLISADFGILLSAVVDLKSWMTGDAPVSKRPVLLWLPLESIF